MSLQKFNLQHYCTANGSEIPDYDLMNYQSLISVDSTGLPNMPLQADRSGQAGKAVARRWRGGWGISGTQAAERLGGERHKIWIMSLFFLVPIKFLIRRFCLIWFPWRTARFTSGLYGWTPCLKALGGLLDFFLIIYRDSNDARLFMNLHLLGQCLFTNSAHNYGSNHYKPGP